MKNDKIIQDNLKKIRDFDREVPLFNEFQKKRVELCHEYSEKDADNKSVITDGNFVIVEASKEAFELKFKELQAQYMDAIKEKTNKEVEFSNLFTEEIEVKLYKIKLDFLPEDLTVEELAQLEAVIME